MRKLIIGLAVAGASVLCGCNKEIFDTNYVFDRAIVRWPDGTTKELKIKQWTDYPGEQVQIRTPDGKVYLVSTINAVLVRD